MRRVAPGVAHNDGPSASDQPVESRGASSDAPTRRSASPMGWAPPEGARAARCAIPAPATSRTAPGARGRRARSAHAAEGGSARWLRPCWEGRGPRCGCGHGAAWRVFSGTGGPMRAPQVSHHESAAGSTGGAASASVVRQVAPLARAVASLVGLLVGWPAAWRCCPRRAGSRVRLCTFSRRNGMCR